jgi:hypothetical protein
MDTLDQDCQALYVDDLGRSGMTRQLTSSSQADGLGAAMRGCDDT